MAGGEEYGGGRDDVPEEVGELALAVLGQN